jgi:hypothetical protein
MLADGRPYSLSCESVQAIQCFKWKIFNAAFQSRKNRAQVHRKNGREVSSADDNANDALTVNAAAHFDRPVRGEAIDERSERVCFKFWKSDAMNDRLAEQVVTESHRFTEMRMRMRMRKRARADVEILAELTLGQVVAQCGHQAIHFHIAENVVIAQESRKAVDHTQEG